MSSQDRVVAGSSDRHQAVEVVVGWSALSLEPSADGTGMDAEGTGHVPPPPLAVDRLADFADSGDNLHIAALVLMGGLVLSRLGDTSVVVRLIACPAVWLIAAWVQTT